MGVKIYEVTIKHLICTDTKDHAEKEMIRRFGTFYQSMETREIENPECASGDEVVCYHPEPEDESIPF